MKIVKPYAEILAHLDHQSIATRIEECGRICYKSEDKITKESAIPFIEKVIKHGHKSVLEMGMVTLEICCSFWDYFDLIETAPKYLHLSKVMSNEDRSSGADRVRLLITGSIRAWREMLIKHPNCAVVQAACALLNERHPYFFSTILPQGGFTENMCITARKVPLKEVEALPVELMAKHRHIAVKFIVNRAVTHEMVRHRPCQFLQESQRYCRYSDDKFGNEVTFIKPLFWAEDSDEYAIWQQAMEDEERRYFKLLETSTPQAARTVLPNSCKTELIVYANLEQWRHIFKLRCSKAAEPSMREVMIPLQQDFQNIFPNF